MVSRIVCNQDRSEVNTPKLTFMVVLPNNEAYETDSILGLMSLIVDSRYQDNENETDGWHFRVLYARKVAMQLLMENINVIVHDKDKGIIKNNYAAKSDDADYEEDENEVYERTVEIEVSTEKAFLESLLALGIIVLYERSDSKQFKEKAVSCAVCSFACKGKCRAYGGVADNTGGCDSGTTFSTEEKEGLEYIVVNSERY